MKEGEENFDPLRNEVLRVYEEFNKRVKYFATRDTEQQ